MPESYRLYLVRYGVALGAVVAATVLRVLLEPVLGDFFPFATIFFAILVAAWHGGFGPALAATLAGTLATWIFLLPPQADLATATPEQLAGLLLYLLVGAGISLLGGSMREARIRAEAHLKQATDRQEQLASEILRRQQIEHELRASQQWFEVFMNYAPMAAYVKDQEGRYRYVNAELMRQFKLRRDDLLGKTDLDLFPAEMAAQYRENDERALSSGELLHVQETSRHDDGVHHWLSFKFPIDDAQGNRLLAGVSLDITDMKRIEQRLFQQREQLLVTLISIGDAVIATDREARVTFLNPVAEQLTGWSQSDAEGVPLSDVFKIVNEYTRLPVESPVEKALREGTIVGLANHTILIAKDGAERPIDDSAAPIKDEDGNLVGVVLVFRDVTERQRAERERRHLAAIVESSNDAVIGFELDGSVRSWNSGAERLYGYTAEEVVGQTLSMLAPPDRPDELPALIERLRGGERIEHFETARITKDGRRIDVSLTISPIRTAEGDVIGASKIARDITPHKRAEKLRNARLAVTQSLAQATSPDETVPELLRGVCQSLDWQLGVYWEVDRLEQEVRCAELWSPSAELFGEFADATRQLSLGRNGSLPGRVWASGQPLWLRDVTRDANFMRAEVAARVGLHGGFACPVSVADRAIGVIEFFCREPRECDDDLVEMLTTLAGQLGQFIERERAKAALRESEAQLRQLADAMPQIVWTSNADGVTDYYNRRWYELTGLDPEQQELADPQPFIHPDEADEVNRRWQRCWQEGTAFQMEIRLKDARTGAYRWHLARSVPVKNAAGQVVRWYGTSTDIDEQKRAADVARFLAEASAALASSVDYEITLQTVARQAVPFFADWCAVDLLTSEGSLRRLAVAHVDPSRVALAEELNRRFPPDPQASSGVWSILRSGRPQLIRDVSPEFLDAEVQNEQRRQAIRELGFTSYIGVPLSIRGKAMGVIMFLMAESNRRYTESDLAMAEDLAHRAAVAIDNATLYQSLQEADRRKTEFLATLAHELRNPLAPIRSGLELMKMVRNDPETLEQTRGMMERQTQQLITLVDDLLEVSRITRGKLELRKCRVSLSDVVQIAIEASRPLIDEAGHALSVALPEEPIDFDADPHRLAQVLSNLLNNAAKYTPDGGHIWLQVRRGGDDAVISVRDNGIGIEPDMKDRIFEMFAQVDRPIEKAYTGLGIGLTLVRTLVEMHGGTIDVRSEGANRGSEFIVRLPILVEAASNEPRLLAADEAAPAAGTLRVLVVDDNNAAAEMLAKVVRILGGEAWTARDGQQAIDLAEREAPHVILMDLGMPRMNGYEAARHIRKQPWGEKIMLVALTGWGQEEDKQRTKDAGFDHHLVKPAEPAELRRLFSEVRPPSDE